MLVSGSGRLLRTVAKVYMPPTATPEAYHHFVGVMTTAGETVFGPPTTPDTVPGLVSSAAKILHNLVKVHPY